MGPGQTLHLVDINGNSLHNYRWELEEDGTGTIPVEEFGTLMRCMGLDPTEAQIQDVIDEINAGREKAAGSPQLLLSMARTSETCMRHLFVAYVERKASGGRPCFLKAFDRDGCGFASKADIRQFIAIKARLLGDAGEDMIDQDFDVLFNNADIDGDGLLSY